MSRILVTGSMQGIGAETARQLITLGHEVVVHARNADRAAEASIATPGAIAVVLGDLSSIESTKALAAQALEHGPYDAIVHNAGVGGSAPQRALTADGIERIFHINVVGPYLLTCLVGLAPRMIYLTSGLEENGRTVLDDLQWERRPWDPMQAYSDSKLYDSMLAFELAATNPSIVVNSVDPGWIHTQLGGPQAPDPVALGADTQVWLTDSDDPIAMTSGQYVKRREVLTPNPDTQNRELRYGLIEALERLTGVTLP